MNSSHAVSLHDVHMAYGANRVLKGITLNLEEGEFVTLLGPSGCGKTTLLRILAGFLRPTQGRVVIRGREVTGLPAYKRNLGMVFQNYALWPHMTVRKHIAFGLKLAKLSSATIEERIQWSLALVGLAGFEERVPGELSGGQQQRVALARAISLHPTILLLDEPLSNLDRKLRDEMRVELRQLHQKLGFTTVYVTHDQQEAVTMSDRVVVLKDGLIEQEASPRNLYETPGTVFVAKFLGASNLLPVMVDTVEDKVARVRLNEKQLRVPVNNRQVDFNKAYLVLRPEYLALAPEGAAPDTVLAGTVLSCVYEGNGIRYTIALADSDASVIMLAPSHTEVPPGASVSVIILQSSLVPDKGERLDDE